MQKENRLKIFLFLALMAILLSRAESFMQFRGKGIIMGNIHVKFFNLD